MKAPFSLTLILVLPLLASAAEDKEFSLNVGSRERSYIVHLPTNYKIEKPIPLLLNFHGGGGSAEAQIKLTSMNQKADQEKFIVIYPEGSSRWFKKRFLTFNSGSVCCAYARDQKVDDVAFTRAILDDMEKRFPIDRRRIYVTGHSNGGMMAYRLACELSDRIAAVASVAGPMGIDTCTPSRPISVLHFHGTADECAPFKGGQAKAPGAGIFPSPQATIDRWIKTDQCNGETKDVLSKGDVTCSSNSSCKAGSEVMYCKVSGGGHAWPGASEYPSKSHCGGKLTHDISANDVMWDFFQRHPLPEK